MLPIIPISRPIIKVSCIYMHISVSFTFFADTEGTTAYGPTTLCGALAIAHARVYINKVYDHVGGSVAMLPRWRAASILITGGANIFPAISLAVKLISLTFAHDYIRVQRAYKS